MEKALRDAGVFIKETEGLVNKQREKLLTALLVHYYKLGWAKAREGEKHAKKSS